jgi:hypothetical protein
MALIEIADRGFVCSYQDPPAHSAYWQGNVAGTTPALQGLIGIGSYVVIGGTRDQLIKAARAYVDKLLHHYPHA